MLEAPAVVADFDDVAMMSEAIEDCRHHLGVAKDLGPFCEVQVGGGDDRGAFVEPAGRWNSSGPPDWANGR